MLWLDGRVPDRLDEQCRNLVNVLAPGEGGVANPVDVLHSVLATKDERWLLVLDDVVHPDVVRRFVPAAGPGDVVITSREVGWRRHPALRVGPLDVDASARLLYDAVEGLPWHAALAVAAVVGGSPRFLVRTGEHLATNTAVDWTSYLRLYAAGLAEVTASGMPQPNTAAAGSVRDGRLELFVVERRGRLMRRWCEPWSYQGWSRWWPVDEPEPLARGDGAPPGSRPVGRGPVQLVRRHGAGLRVLLAAVPRRPVRIHVVNPNTTAAMTEAIGRAATAIAGPDVRVRTTCPPMGPASIESHYDEALSVPGLLSEIASSPADGYVIACFGDPGLEAARELAASPVIGIAEAAMRTAAAPGTSRTGTAWRGSAGACRPATCRCWRWRRRWTPWWPRAGRRWRRTAPTWSSSGARA